MFLRVRVVDFSKFEEISNVQKILREFSLGLGPGASTEWGTSV